VHNEGATIDRVLRSIVAAGLPSGIEREMVVINDGSTDRTAAELETFRQAHPELALVYHHERVNHGKGWCLRRGIPMATGDCIVIQDADLEYDPGDHAAQSCARQEDRISRRVAGAVLHRKVYVAVAAPRGKW
jgi:glycosyltransferase involved in cell wall biosynthesis